MEAYWNIFISKTEQIVCFISGCERNDSCKELLVDATEIVEIAVFEYEAIIRITNPNDENPLKWYNSILHYTSEALGTPELYKIMDYPIKIYFSLHFRSVKSMNMFLDDLFEDRLESNCSEEYDEEMMMKNMKMMMMMNMKNMKNLMIMIILMNNPSTQKGLCYRVLFLIITLEYCYYS